MLKITMLLASILALIYVWLAFQVINLRRKHKVSIGGGGQNQLEMAIRAHGNFAEYVPLSLILLACAELSKANQLVLIGFAILILVGRVFHAHAFLFSKEHLKSRVRGMKLTFLSLVGLALFNIGQFIVG